MKREAFSDSDMKTIVNRIDFCTGLISKLGDIIQTNIGRMRSELLSTSNQFFKDMTNKPDVYDHLEYIQDNSYSMTIIKKDGTSVPQGSTGEWKIVMMSFLMALSKCSGRSTPIVMDNPTTDLDSIHSKGVERSLKSLSSQVLFLVQTADNTDLFIDTVKDITAKRFKTIHDSQDNGMIEEVSD